MSGVREIPLSRGLVALVDEADFDWLNQWKWSALKVGRKGSPPKYYAVRVAIIDGRQKMLMMHREISSAPKGKVVDHRDRNSLNNTRDNLRVCTQAANTLNRAGNSSATKTSSYKGVYWQKDIGRWRARFRLKYLGTFSNEHDAARAYDAAAAAFNPEFAHLNLK